MNIIVQNCLGVRVCKLSDNRVLMRDFSTRAVRLITHFVDTF